MDWLAFLQQRGVDHQVGPSGKVRRGHVGVHCPRCPGDDGYHFAVELETGKVRGCWRDRGHWMPPHELAAAVGGIGEAEARRLCYGDGPAGPSGSVEAMLERLKEKPCRAEAPTPIELPPEFRRFEVGPLARLQRPFLDYLTLRGFGADIVELAGACGLRWCASRSSTWNGRIVFPIWRRDRRGMELRGWTARSILLDARVRYRAHPPGDAMAGLLWEGPAADWDEVVVLVEGPFDALKVVAACWSVAPWLRVQACALLSNSAGPGKASRLAQVVGGRRLVVLLDRGAEAQAVRVASDLAVLRPEVHFVPGDWKDPGDVPILELRRFLGRLL